MRLQEWSGSGTRFCLKSTAYQQKLRKIINAKHAQSLRLFKAGRQLLSYSLYAMWQILYLYTLLLQPWCGTVITL